MHDNAGRKTEHTTNEIMCRDALTKVTLPLSTKSRTPIPAKVLATRWVSRRSAGLASVTGGRRDTAYS